MIKKHSLSILQKAINFSLSLDDNMPQKMAELNSKVIEMIIEPLAINFFIQFTDGKLILLDNYAEKPDTIIQSSPLGLIRLSFLPASKARSLFNDKIRISGDVELGQQVKQLFDNLDIDWEGHLAHFTGDVVAHQIGSLFRQGYNFKNRLQNSLRDNLRDYVHEEVRLFPSREEIEDFYHDIDELALAVERLEAKINLIWHSNETD